MLTTDHEALRLIDQIAERAIELGDDRPKAEIAADLSMTHFSCPLRLDDFLAGDTINLIHDIYGIAGHLDRNTGKLSRRFQPRFAAQ